MLESILVGGRYVAEDIVLQFGSLPTPQVRACLEAATLAANVDEAEVKLLEARQLDPLCLATYFALYKYYFWRRRLAEAEEAARGALAAAASVGGFPADWQKLNRASVDWQALDGPERCYLFSLKALAFIRLRRGAMDDGRALLAKLAEIDPCDQVGASVVRGIADAVSEVQLKP